jgi:uncharacterized membrane protein YphA (DoxX/SURF4 family)
VTSASGLRVLSIALGVFLIFMGLDKLDWLMDSSLLVRRLEEWRESAAPIARWYLDTIAIPGASVFARLVPVGELAAGAALLSGIKVRLAASVSLLMVLNFHFASDVLFHYSYFTNAYGPPVLGGLLALAIGGTRLPLSLSK